MARQDGDDRVVGGAPYQDTRHSHNATILDRRYNSAIILGDRQTDIFPPRRRPILQVDQRTLESRADISQYDRNFCDLFFVRPGSAVSRYWTENLSFCLRLVFLIRDIVCLVLLTVISFSFKS